MPMEIIEAISLMSILVGPIYALLIYNIAKSLRTEEKIIIIDQKVNENSKLIREMCEHG
jgi:hypothetical protein